MCLFFWLSEGVGGLGNILGLSAGLFHMANAADIGNTPDITTPFFCFELLLWFETARAAV